MSAPGEDTLPNEDGEMEEMEGGGSDEDEMEEEGKYGEQQTQVYVPGIQPLQPGEELEMDRSAYRMYHECQTGAPCLSFDVLRDAKGDGREQYPLSMLLCAGTQADAALSNRLVVIRMHNLHGTTEKEKEGDESSDGESDEDDDEDKKPQMELAMMPHYGGINRVRVTHRGDQSLAAVWSEKGQVEIFDLRSQMEAVHSSAAMSSFVKQQKEATPLFSFSGHMTEGFAIDWSPKVPGRLVSGDCKKNIHVWEPREGGTSWQIDQRPFSSHTKSVEDLQWSPTEATVFASCSVDQSIRVWDTRAPPNSMLCANEAHSSDVNVISWNRIEPFILSGGDDGLLKVWDLRQFQSGRPVANFKQHSAPVTSVEWNPVDSSVFAASGADDVVSQWDLSVESCDVGARSEGVKDLPPQLLFLHQGQTEVKEIHWHPQIPGMMVSTALSGFNVFRTIKRLQLIQNAAARLVFNLPKFSHVTPLLRTLHWLPVEARICYKTMVLAYGAVRGTAPPYLQALISPYTQTRALRSSTSGLLAPLPLRKHSSLSAQSKLFAALAPQWWNKLPHDARTAESLTTFRRHLKPHLFKEYLG